MKTIDRICVAVGAGVAAGAVTFTYLWARQTGGIGETPSEIWSDQWERGMCLVIAAGTFLTAWGFTGLDRQPSRA